MAKPGPLYCQNGGPERTLVIEVFVKLVPRDSVSRVRALVANVIRFLFFDSSCLPSRSAERLAIRGSRTRTAPFPLPSTSPVTASTPVVRWAVIDA